ncbi:hypothetical protein [Halorhabdus sp. BNX81]|uniref:hypothetical protein n=1 Tax=Halorhabdus sp. BNX81 TaxID=2980181 RepID=UPI0023DD2EAE|nr:hypothetical protein [Halorhabdus sp. BNX81]
MIDWSTAIPTALGGAVSGVIGLIAVGYQNQNQRKREVEQWYSRVERLAQRIQRVNYGDWTGPKPKIAQKTCAGVHAELAQHLADAPPAVDESLLDLCETLIAECQQVKMVRPPVNTEDIDPDETKNRVRKAAEKAQQVEQSAKEKRGDLGLF